MQSTVEVILLGDFNAPDINRSTVSASSDFSSNLCDLIFQFNCVQQLDLSTHIHGNILDLIITTSVNTVSDINLTQEFNQVIKSDHHLISFKLCITYSTPITSKDPVYIFDYHKGDYDGLNKKGQYSTTRPRQTRTDSGSHIRSPQPTWSPPLVPFHQLWIYMVGKKHSRKADQSTLAIGGSEHA